MQPVKGVQDKSHELVLLICFLAGYQNRVPATSWGGSSIAREKLDKPQVCVNSSLQKYNREVVSCLKNLDEVFEMLTTMESNDVEWVFRGHTNDYDFQTSLERAFLAFSEDRPHSGDPDYKAQLRSHLEYILKNGLRDGSDRSFKIQAIEGGLLRRFKRQCYQYGFKTPADENIMEWLALMQHHGAPT